MTNAETRILLIQIASDNDEVHAFSLTYRLLLFCRLCRLPVRIVPLGRIKAKKIPIVQPILTLTHKKDGYKIFIHIFQMDMNRQK